MPSSQLSIRKTSRLRTRSKSESKESPIVAYCLQIVDACLLGILFLAPLFFGGRHLMGRFVLIALACVAGVAWFTHQTLQKQAKWTNTWANVLGFAALLLVAFQLVPLPTPWLEYLAPRNTELLTLWNNSETPRLGDWQTLSLTPASTRIALATLVAYVLLFVTVTGRLKNIEDVQRLMRIIAIAVMAMAGFGLVQYFTANGLFLWFYEHPYSSTFHAVTGSFSTRNHFAHFLVLGSGPLLAWIVLHLLGSQGKSKAKSSKFGAPANRKSPSVMLMLTAGFGVVAFAVLMSLSRGGALALLVASSIAVAVYFWRGLVSGAFLYGLLLLGLLMAGSLSFLNDDVVAKRLEDFTSGSLQELDENEGRRKIWKANLASIESGSLFGAGAGSHREIYPIYFPQPSTIHYTHAENGPLQIGTENGLLGIGLLVLSVTLVFRWCWVALRRASSNQEIALAGAVAASLAASLIHSSFDFVWFTPSCMSLTILLAACALRLAQLSMANVGGSTGPVDSTVWSQPRWIGLSATVCCGAIWAVSVSWGPALASMHWDKYQLVSSEEKQPLPPKITEEVLLDIVKNRTSRAEVMIFHLQHALACDPGSATAHFKISKMYLELFELKQQNAENQMSLDEIRDAAVKSQFSSSKALKAWLKRAFGSNHQLLYHAHFHARQALEICPLQGEAYLYLANLCFLEGQHASAIQAYVEQSQRVRPYSGAVFCESGQLRYLLGDRERAVRNWQTIYHNQGSHQKKIFRMLSGVMSATNFLQTFEPDWSTFWPIWQYYRQWGNEQDWQSLLEYGVVEAGHDRSRKTSLQEAYVQSRLGVMHRSLGQTELSLRFYQNAHEVVPNNYDFRRELGRAFYLAKQYQLARPHLRWCLDRKPEDAVLKQELIESTKSRLPQTATTLSPTTHR